jgi:hypothetical protein
MVVSFRPVIAAVAAAVASATLLVAAPQQGAVEPGDLVEYTFRGTMLGEPGPASLAELRGRPVLIDFWGTR